MSSWIYKATCAVGAVLGAVGAIVVSKHVHVNDWTQPILIGIFAGISTGLAGWLGKKLQLRYDRKAESV